MKLATSAITAGTISLAAAVALAHGGATGIVKERMDGMSALAKSMKAIAPMIKGQAPYDADALAAAAREIAAHAGDAITGKFPEGTDHPPSEALPEIWQDWDTFVALSNQLETAARGLELAAANGPAPTEGKAGMMGGQGMMGGDAPMMSPEHIGQMPPQMAFAMVGQTCLACHKRFRAETE